MNENQSLSHTKWSYKPYIVFAQKFRRKEIYLKMKDDRGKILRQCCDQKRYVLRKGADRSVCWLSFPLT